MRPIGFSTGALAFGDFRRALSILHDHTVAALELSALRDTEVGNLMSALPSLDLSRYGHVSVHAPSRFSKLSESEVARTLEPCIELKIPIVLHPDAINDFASWLRFGRLLCIENMDNRKTTGRTVAELIPVFEKLPEAGFCFDVAHARQVDATMSEARELLHRFGERLVQVHLSEIDAAGHHQAMSSAAIRAVRRIGHLVPEQIPIILESMVSGDQVDREVVNARRAFERPKRGSVEREILFSTID